jgi:hypothetical protein
MNLLRRSCTIAIHHHGFDVWLLEAKHPSPETSFTAASEATSIRPPQPSDQMDGALLSNFNCARWTCEASGLIGETLRFVAGAKNG